MARTITLKYWFVHDDRIGNIFEDEQGNRIIVFDGHLKVGEPFRVKEINGDEVDAEEIGLIQLLRAFVVATVQTK